MMDTEAMLGRASPRNPRVVMVCRSSAFRSLLVVWRWKARDSSSAGMPEPLSLTLICSTPLPSPAS